MKLKFSQDGWVDGKLVFEKGKTYEVPSETGSAERWIRRGMALPESEFPAEAPAQEAPQDFSEVDEQTLENIAGDEGLMAEVVEEEDKPTKKKGKKGKDQSTDLL